MPAAYRAQPKRPNLRSDKVVGTSDMPRKNAAMPDDLTDRICRVARTEAKHNKPAQWLACFAGIGGRQAERILGGRQQITWPALRTLLSSVHASKFHWALMESFGAHEYWDDLRNQLREANLEAEISAKQHELDELKARKRP